MLPTALALILVSSSVILMVVGLPMALGRVAQNRLYGVRLPVTLRSRAAWEAANTHYGWWLIAAGGVSLPIILVIWLGGLGSSSVLVWVAALTVPILGGLPSTVTRAYRAERRERADSASANGGDPPAGGGQGTIPPQFRS